MARIARWFLDITLDAATLRWWNGAGDISFEGQTYTGLGRRFKTPDGLQHSSSLRSETITLEFDGSRQTDNADPVGALLDQRWRRRAVRLRQLAWDPGQGPDDGEVLDDERGRIKNLPGVIEEGRAPAVRMQIESGALAYLERRMETRSPAGQKRVFPDDQGFDLTAKLEGVTLPWRTKYKKSGTVALELQDEYEPEPRKLGLGRFVTQGSFVAAFTVGQQRKTLIRIYGLLDHRISKLDRVWINGDVVRSAALTHGARTVVRLQGDGGDDRCWLTFYDGRHDQVADTYLDGLSTQWTSNHRLRGVSYIIVEHLWDSDLPENFDYRFSGEGALLYDRRKDTTAGGSGLHRWDDPDTWEYSTNAMVAVDHYRSGIRIAPGNTSIWFGVGEAVDAVPYAEYAELANHCDEDVPLKAGGTQKRYEVNGILSADAGHDKNLEALANQMAARPIDQGGRLAIRPPVIRMPVITITDGDLVRGSASQIDPGAGISDMLNTLEGRFVNPQADYKMDDYPRVSIDTYVDDDNGRIDDTLSLDLEISGERSQRIAKLRIEESRAILEIEETYTAAARVIVPGEWYTRSSALRGFSAGKTFRATKVRKGKDGSRRVTAREIYPDQLVWNEATAVDLPAPPELPALSLDDMPVPVIAASAVDLISGDTHAPGVRLDVTLPADLTDLTADRVVMEFGLSDGGVPPAITGTASVLFFDPDRAQVDFGGFLPLTAYAMRFRYVDGVRAGAWSAFQAVTTTAASGGADGVDGSDGNTVAQLSVYRRAASAPATPTGGSFNFDTLTLTAPADWSATIPGGTDPVWSCVAIASITGTTGTDAGITWSAPAILAQNGAAGATGATGAPGADGSAGRSVYTAIVFKRSASAPAAPSGGSFNFGTNVLTPPAGWFLDVPAGTDPIYGTRYVFSVIGDTGSVTAAAWATPFRIAEDGAAGLDGAVGADGISTYQISVYRRLATTPATPAGGSYNFGTQALTAPSLWSGSVPAGSEAVWVSHALASVAGVTGTDSTLTWTAPAILAQNGAAGATGATGAPGATGPAGPAGATGAAGAAGQRGAQLFFAAGTAWSDAAANAAITASGYTKVLGDRVTIHSASPAFSQTRIWNGAAWEILALVLDGALLVNGSVTAAALNVTTVSAISANLGVVTAGLMRNAGSTFAINAGLGVSVQFSGGYMKVVGANFGASGSLIEWYGPTPSGATVTDPKLSTLTTSNAIFAQDNTGKTYDEVSILSAAYTAGIGGASAVGDGWMIWQSLAVTATGRPLLVTASILSRLAPYDTDDAAKSVRIRRGATTIYQATSFHQSFFGQDTYQPFATMLTDTPPAGSYTYTIETTHSISVSNADSMNRALTIMELKR